VTTDNSAQSIARLLDVMATLRSPEGCPWDRAQTFDTIAPYTIEEAYEVADAIARADLTDLKDELGDLLLQVVYHARIAEEVGAFSFADVALAITGKMIRRHPHVFGSQEERAAGASPGFWERIKVEERAAKVAERARLGRDGQGAGPLDPENSGLLANVPVGLPGLTRAIKLQDKAASVGFDWPSVAPVLEKIEEEIGELKEVLGGGDADRIEDEFGDLLFVMANLARHLKLDPEAALRRANGKFTRRFAHIERALTAEGRTPAQSNLAEMDQLWDAAKALERAAG
jgi:nucleoside triphosphate diphosphatase